MVLCCQEALVGSVAIMFYRRYHMYVDPQPNSPLTHFYQPILSVMASETIVDWLKHAFITKFNHIRPSVYERYTDVLCRDLASASAVSRLGVRKVSRPTVLVCTLLTLSELALVRRSIASSGSTPGFCIPTARRPGHTHRYPICNPSRRLTSGF